MQKLNIQSKLVIASLVAASHALGGCGGHGSPETTRGATGDKLTAENVRAVSLDAFGDAFERVKAAQPEVNTESEEFRQALLKDIKEGSASRSYDIGNVTGAEWRLLVAHPVYAWKTRDATNAAIRGATDFFPGVQYLTRGDAFRHTFWNVLLSKRCSSWWAEAYATAHESETRDGDDKTMDLSNNAAGRRIFRENSQMSEGQLAEKIRSGSRWAYRYSNVSFDDSRILYMRG